MNINFKTEYQKEMYENLMKLTKEHSEFSFNDFPIPGTNFFYRIFKYSLPSYTQFLYPYAKDIRGTMFIVDKDTLKADLIALPMQKFFNFGEGLSQEVKERNINDVKRIFIKEDGSLLTAYVSPIDDKLYFKSKSVITYSPYELIEKALSADLEADLYKVYKEENLSICLELTSPKNRVMMEYKENKLHVLQARCLLTGKEVDMRNEEFKAKYPAIFNALVKEVGIEDYDINRSDIEGYVVEMNNGERLKVKTIPYLSLVAVVNIQDLKSLSAKLYTAAINEVMDEVRTMYHYKNRSENYPIDLLIKQADVAEEYARKTYLPMVKEITNFVEENKGLEMSEYVKKVNKEVNPAFKPAVMMLYKGKDFDIKSLAVKIYGNKALSAMK